MLIRTSSSKNVNIETCCIYYSRKSVGGMTIDRIAYTVAGIY